MIKNIALGAVAALFVAGSAQAAVVRMAETNFKPESGLITFSEHLINTANPVYTPAQYGGGAAAPYVSFGGWFLGQALSTQAHIDCPGAAATACVVGTPTASLSLDPNAPQTYIASDGANPTSPVLSGRPMFNGPIAVLFDRDMVAVGFDGGYFNAVASTGITAFARDGSRLGTIANERIGIEFLGLVSQDGSPSIAGVFLDLVGAEPAGFAIDNLRFGVAGQVVLPPEVAQPAPVPLPAAAPMLLAALGAIGLLRRRRTT
ncbi:VPLPA-CTERM sorting domain-containing protein [Paracoccus sp. (in: a-proteobacteria)]|uniref:VPLPA-CTERM sorting domain-containing protein n=1 Tax=Paracoccus sp. TaxID=267 RepID=UPI0026E0C2CA|nr:VPLPA-CTERM sorting domain-containing protein [Paracoccus sp. (in: a-proteobacteria)]MDO5648670.1 VPLPA-CTERM sorting domain-containing protein [Paracoccus sp. (in: a-proteobacteria)]